jgi:hypothetical protein
MALPGSGTITWQQICAEFGLDPATAVWPTSFYGKGGAPAAGTLGFADFYGRANGGTFTPPPGTYSYTDNGYSGGASVGASVTIFSNSGAVAWTWSKTGSTALTASLTTGSSGTQITFELPPATGTLNRTATVTLTVGGNTWTLTLNATGLDNGGFGGGGGGGHL